ncbi:exonuclease SbcCD subunit D [Clostridia bacterium]|nr:exonuclease SbcCD subunit D [Clostridia bacterium]
MRVIHISDLHLGKRVNEFPMMEDQKHIIEQILAIAEDEEVSAVIIAGDIYDKSLPSAEAIELFDQFLTNLAEKKIQVFGISGNHDSAERVGYCAEIMCHQGIHLCKPYNGKLQCIEVMDKFGPLNIYLMPFIKPANVRRFDENIEIGSYEDAVKSVLRSANINPESRNLLLAHQFVTHNGVQPERSDSEVISVGGLDNIDSSVFKDFDYVALGHIHRPQNVGRPTIRYSGSPLKYSFSEVNHNKSVTIVELREKGTVLLKEVALTPIRDMKKLKGSITELLSSDFYESINTNDYYHITLTDEAVMDAIGKLRMVYPNIMRLEFESSSVEDSRKSVAMEKIELSNTLEIFEEFYERQNGTKMDQTKRDIIVKLLSEEV